MLPEMPLWRYNKSFKNNKKAFSTKGRAHLDLNLCYSLFHPHWLQLDVKFFHATAKARNKKACGDLSCCYDIEKNICSKVIYYSKTDCFQIDLYVPNLE